MRCILGYLNQAEWVQNVNIGNIMQINPLPMTDLLIQSKNDLTLYRNSFLDKLSTIVVGYFCISTELRFQITVQKDLSNDERDEKM
jgi:hypothetical protein